MKEFQAILEAYRQIDFSRKKVALATVVRVVGSSYRSPGARMLIMDDGKWVGSISGGCLEGDALRKARQVMWAKQAVTVRYDTSDEENKSLGINLGCQGIIDVLFEPVDSEDAGNPIRFFETRMGSEEEIAVATIFSGTDGLMGKKMLIKQHNPPEQNFTHAALSRQVQHDLEQLLETKKSRPERYAIDNEEFEVFLELIQPSIKLLIFGGGFDARSLSQMAKTLGWSVTVTDECVAHIAPVFFPQADVLSLCRREFVDREFSISSHTACVLMSHNYEYDREVLKKLLLTQTPYIGILGPKKRFDRLTDELASQGMYLSDTDWERIHAPIGVDIGAEAPHEIAIAIIAEIMGKFTNRPAGYLKFRSGPIHQKDALTNQVFKEATI